MPLFKHAAYMFCFSIASSHVSISICKNFAMFLCAIKDLQQLFFYTQALFHYFEADVLCYEITGFTKPPLLIPSHFKWERLVSGELTTLT